MIAALNPLREISFLSVLFRLLLAACCGGVVGVERSFRRRAAGFRTHILTCLGAAMAVFKGLGVYPDLSEAGKKMIAVSHVYNPIPKNRDLYQDIYQHIYLKAYDRYTPLFKRLKHTFHS